MSKSSLGLALAGTLLLALSGRASAQSEEGGGEVSGSWEATPATEVHHHWQFDMFGGGHFFSKDNELGARDVPEAAAPNHSFALGLRLGYWFTPAIGLEAEGIAMPTEAKFRDLAGGDTMDANSEQFVIGYRLNHLYQFNMGSLQPFLLVGAGGESNSSERDEVLMDDTDFVAHAGVGTRYAINDDVGLRLDARVLFPPSSDSESVTLDFEGLAGFYIG